MRCRTCGRELLESPTGLCKSCASENLTAVKRYLRELQESTKYYRKVLRDSESSLSAIKECPPLPLNKLLDALEDSSSQTTILSDWKVEITKKVRKAVYLSSVPLEVLKPYKSKSAYLVSLPKEFFTDKTAYSLALSTCKLLQSLRKAAVLLCIKQGSTPSYYLVAKDKVNAEVLTAFTLGSKSLKSDKPIFFSEVSRIFKQTAPSEKTNPSNLRKGGS